MTVCDGSRSLKKCVTPQNHFHMVAERGCAHGTGEVPVSRKAVGSRRAAWRIIASGEQKELTEDKEEEAACGKERAANVKAELQSIFDAIFSLMDENLVSLASTGESKALYYMMKGDYHRYLAESSTSEQER